MQTQRVSYIIYVFLYIAINLELLPFSPKNEVSLFSTFSYNKVSTKTNPSVGNLKAPIQTYTKVKSHAPPGSPVLLMALPPVLGREVNFFVAVAGSLLFPR